MKRITGFRGMRVLAALAAFTVSCNPALAEPGASASEQLAAKRHECPSEPVTIWYADNPQASGGLYNNPWADCRLSAKPR
jgi:hypothetical protein